MITLRARYLRDYLLSLVSRHRLTFLFLHHRFPCVTLHILQRSPNLFLCTMDLLEISLRLCNKDHPSFNTYPTCVATRARSNVSCAIIIPPSVFSLTLKGITKIRQPVGFGNFSKLVFSGTSFAFFVFFIILL